MKTGTIACYSHKNGTGVIQPDDGGDELWFHWTSAMHYSAMADKLETGGKVRFEVHGVEARDVEAIE